MLFKREKYLKKIRPFYYADDIIKVITGVRRSVKSSLMEMIVDEIKESGIEDDSIIYIDLDKRENRKIKTPDQLEALIESKIKTEGLKFLFLDEVQNVTGFEEVLNGFRTDGGFSIFITGSNSYLLSGRYLEFEMFTLSFEEYVEMKKFYGKPVNPNLSIELNQYILEGGFPRTVLIDDDSAKRTYVSGVVNEIFEKDIKKRNKVRDKATFEVIRNFVINNFGATFSIKSLTEALEKKGNRVTRATATRYINTLVEAKVLYECDRFDLKSKKALAGEKKYYLGDLSFFFSQNTDNSINFGPVLENMVYIYSRSLDYSVSVGRIGKLECDFILRDRENNYSYVQVAYTIMQSRETEDREYRVLENIKDNYAKYVVTTDYMLQKRNGIKHVNLMEFMTSESLF